MKRIGLVMVGVLAAGAVVLGVLVVTADDDGSSEADGSRSASFDEDFRIEQFTGSYRIVYRVDDPTGGAGAETDRVWVRGAFESRLETASGPPPGGDTVSVQIAALGRLRIGGVDDAATIARVPGLAPSALRLVPILDEAEEAGLLEPGEQRIVAGRRCQVYRSGSTLGSGPLRSITADEYADSCIDGDGLLLEETLTAAGAAVFRRTAVDVELGPTLGDDLFDPGDVSAPVDQGGGATTPAEPDSAPEGPFLELPAEDVPAGFELVERFSVIPPQPERFSDPLLRDGIVAGVADVYEDGAGDAFVVYQGGTLGRVDAFEPDPAGLPISNEVLGEGQVVLSALGTELRFPLAGGRFVHVFGTIEPGLLAETAESLVETEGTGLVLLDE